MKFQKSIWFTMNGFFKFMKQFSEDVDIFKISKSLTQNLKKQNLENLKNYVLVFLDGFGKVFF